MHARKLRQRELFDNHPPAPGRVLPREVRDEALQLLTQWLYNLSKAMVEEGGDDQVQNNRESQRRQYALADRARELGWADVEVIDDDLGRSGGGTKRPGFERMLGGLCGGRVGAVFCVEASRLARNGRDWHTLLEFCSVVGALLIDADGVYDPRDPNDRLLCWE